jgi:MFS family permease
VGYYVGIMQSLFFATQAMTVLHWSRLSDVVGRKPVLLVGLFGLSLSMYCFGLSKTFQGLVIRSVSSLRFTYLTSLSNGKRLRVQPVFKRSA